MIFVGLWETKKIETEKEIPWDSERYPTSFIEECKRRKRQIELSILNKIRRQKAAMDILECSRQIDNETD